MHRSAGDEVLRTLGIADLDVVAAGDLPRRALLQIAVGAGLTSDNASAFRARTTDRAVGCVACDIQASLAVVYGSNCLGVAIQGARSRTVARHECFPRITLQIAFP